MTRLRLILADDHQLVLHGLGSLLSTRYDIVARVTDGRSLYEATLQHRPDVVLSDISMPDEDGLAVSRRLLEAEPQTRIVLITMHQDPKTVASALEAGVRGFILKSEAVNELFSAIETVMAGRTYVSPKISSASTPDPEPSDVSTSTRDTLTKRQLEVLRLLGQGRSMKEVASELHISPRTVAFHKYRIMEILELQTNADLIRHALALDPEPL